VPLAAEVLFVERLSDEEADDLTREFESIGLRAELREVPPRRSLSDIAWLALLALPLKPFFEQLAKDSASDVHKGLRSIVGKILQRRHNQPATVPRVLLLQDSASGVQIVLETDLGDDAYRQLLAMDLSRISRGPLHYGLSDLDRAT
jgi:hypothetical protein